MALPSPLHVIYNFVVYLQSNTKTDIMDDNKEKDVLEDLSDDCVVTESGAVMYDIWENEGIIEED